MNGPSWSRQDDPEARRTILVLEGDVVLRLSASDAIRGAGFRVVEAGNSGEAFILLKAYPDIAIVVTDLERTGSMNGRAVAEWLGREMPHVKVVLAEAGSPREIVERIQKLLDGA